MSPDLAAFLYLTSGILFILALRGLSSPETSRQGNLFGILGMTIAIIVTFLTIGSFSKGFIYVVIFLLIGGMIGSIIAFKISMTAMPQLVAGFHSLVGFAAVLVAISAFLKPNVFNLGTGTNHSVLELASMISDETVFIEPRLAESRETLADITRAKTLLGWEPTVKLEDWINK